MKSYTDIEQSKKLAKILPIESADMYYEPSTGYCTEPSEVRFGDIKYAHPRSIRCWSLASLLNVLPNNKHISTTLSRGGWKIEPTEYVDNWWCEYENDDHTRDFSVSADNPVDACVAMILKLRELNLL